jgi:hypothetical protein
MDIPTILIIGGLLLAVISYSYRLRKKPKQPEIGFITVYSIRNNIRFSIFNGENHLNTYAMDFGNSVKIKLSPGSYRLEYTATSGEEGTMFIDVKVNDQLNIQIPVV